jgi:hypothetical protein
MLGRKLLELPGSSKGFYHNVDVAAPLKQTVSSTASFTAGGPTWFNACRLLCFARVIGGTLADLHWAGPWPHFLFVSFWTLSDDDIKNSAVERSCNGNGVDSSTCDGKGR